MITNKNDSIALEGNNTIAKTQVSFIEIYLTDRQRVTLVITGTVWGEIVLIKSQWSGRGSNQGNSEWHKTGGNALTSWAAASLNVFGQVLHSQVSTE